jgi:hypothetical protein
MVKFKRTRPWPRCASGRLTDRSRRRPIEPLLADEIDALCERRHRIVGWRFSQLKAYRNAKRAQFAVERLRIGRERP